ncbi:sodium- and chloride-dependent betaine transporter [Parasteatoda tepidariorum]|uniref:sodium- and chloride-dependent betaine transporter n=1 Tax=Parasteatoda tepidariorum TaxID=114398 RepID=UPI0039BC962D
MSESSGERKWNFKSDEAIASNASDKISNSKSSRTSPKPPRRCQTPDFKANRKLYLPSRPPVLEVKSRLTFGTPDCLSKLDEQTISSPEEERLVRTPSFLSNESSFRFNDADSLPKTVPFGRSRRMSRSLPELRDLQFVSVLPDVEEEESEDSDFQGEEVVYEKPNKSRIPWHRKLDFLWCSACQALGLSNIWRFPYYCYSNGGGSFVLPYLVFMVVCSVPLLCMELAVGQVTQSGPISAIGQLCPLMKEECLDPPSPAEDVTSATLEMTTIQPFLNMSGLASDSNDTQADVVYDRTVNFTHPAVEFFNEKILERSESIGESGELRFEIVAAVLFVWIMTYFALRKTDFFRGNAIYIITVLSHLLLLSIFLRTLSLEGAKLGLYHLFQPEWNKMFSPRVLMYALAQSFHSLGVILGPSILMGSCHKQHNNLLRDTVVVAAVTLSTVLLVGCVTFATIGHLSTKLNKPFWTVLSDDPGNVYVIYSIVIGTMPLPSCWGVLFFLAFLFFGLDSEIKLMATLIGALKEAYTYYIKQRFQGHSLFLAVICGFCFVVSIPYLTQAGIYFFQITDHYVAVVATIVVAIFEISTLSWIYGAKNLANCIQQMTGKTASYFYQFAWIILTPVTILATVFYSASDIGGTVVKRGYTYPNWAHVMGWMLFSLTLCWIPFLAIAAYRKAPASHFISRFMSTIQPNIRSQSGFWEPKPVIILNGSTVTSSEFPDYKLPELPSVQNAVQNYVEKHSILHNKAETNF